MSDIDWSKAPEGATHWDTGGNGRVAGWMRLSDGIWSWWPVEGATCEKRWYATGNTQPVESFIQRKSLWTGVGLPPVGTVCEFKANILGWVQATITAVTEMSIVFTRPSYQNGRPLVEERLPHKAIERFRPIRTPEQIAAEERIAEINQMIGAINDHPNKYQSVTHLSQLKIQEDACIDLYDAGWRKVTP